VDEHKGTELANFLTRALSEIKADRDTLTEVVHRLKSSPSKVKDATAWLTEKLTRVKLFHPTHSDLGTFESLEVLVLGISGKLALWKALAAIAPQDTRLQGIDFDHLQQRAEKQRAGMEEQRLRFARIALLPAVSQQRMRGTG